MPSRHHIASWFAVKCCRTPFGIKGLWFKSRVGHEVALSDHPVLTGLEDHTWTRVLIRVWKL